MFFAVDEPLSWSALEREKRQTRTKRGSSSVARQRSPAALAAYVEDTGDEQIECGLELVGLVRVAEKLERASDGVRSAELTGSYGRAESAGRRSAGDGDEGKGVQARYASRHASSLSPVAVEDNESGGTVPGERRGGYELRARDGEEHAVLNARLPQRNWIRRTFERGVVDHFTAGDDTMDEVPGIALARAFALVTDHEKTHW